LDIEQVYAGEKFSHCQTLNPETLYNQALDEAVKQAQKLPDEFSFKSFESDLEKLMYFCVAEED
jgi:hypothetical protein